MRAAIGEAVGLDVFVLGAGDGDISRAIAGMSVLVVVIVGMSASSSDTA